MTGERGLPDRRDRVLVGAVVGLCVVLFLAALLRVARHAPAVARHIPPSTHAARSGVPSPPPRRGRGHGRGDGDRGEGDRGDDDRGDGD